MEKEMNFFDLCVAIGRAIGRCCAACGRLVARMLRLTYRYWYIVVTLVVLAVAAAIYNSRNENLTYKMNEILQIDFNIKITTAGSGTSTYGISTALLRTLSDEIPSLTPVDGGVLTVFNSSGALTNLMGASFLADGAYWKPAYVNDGVLTGINESSFSNGMTLTGTCYGKYVFED